MRILQFTNEEDLKILTKKLPKCKSKEDYAQAWENKLKMFSLCQEYNWSWLSSNQIWIEKRFFVMFTRDNQLLIINPILVSWDKSVPSKEWCLSFANWKQNFKKRFKNIKVRFEDENAMRFEASLSWYDAIVFQHELDHMNWKII